MSRVEIPFEVWRGGTSRAIILAEDSLPSAGPHRDAVLSGLVGNRSRLQIDGLGGNHPLTSKLAILAAGGMQADVRFTFAQASVDGGRIEYAANCGNISATVVPWALAHGWISERQAMIGSTVLTTSSGTVFRSRIGGRMSDLTRSVAHGEDTLVSLDFLEPGGGAATGLLPTGASSDRVRLDGRRIRVTVVDAGNLAMIVSAKEWETVSGVAVSRLVGGEAEPFEKARIALARELGLTDRNDRVPPNTPKLLIVDAPADGVPWPRKDDTPADVWGVTVSMGTLHTSFPVTGGIALAAALSVPGSTIAELLNGPRLVLALRHLGGVTTFRTDVDARGEVSSISVERSVRRIAQGTAYA
jgi:2-methylaconitate cis-trans-isomerase PrpF